MAVPGLAVLQGKIKEGISNRGKIFLHMPVEVFESYKDNAATRVTAGTFWPNGSIMQCSLISNKGRF